MDQEPTAWTDVLLASLRAENTLLWEVVRAVADADCSTCSANFDMYCIFQCNGQNDSGVHFIHVENCPSMKARALVEQAKRGNR